MVGKLSGGGGRGFAYAKLAANAQARIASINHTIILVWFILIPMVTNILLKKRGGLKA
jgi:hypothetical protein